MSSIGTLNEKSLHAALKQWYAGPGDTFEVPVDGYLIDICRGALLIEIQTRNLARLKKKLEALVACHPVRLVYPIAREKWIVRVQGRERTRRKSPHHGSVEHVFEELVSLPRLLAHPNFSLEVVLIQEEEVRRFKGVTSRRSWLRRGWVTQERRLIEVVDRRLFETPADMLALLPQDLASPFTTADLAVALGGPLWLAQKMAYCLREMGALHPLGKRGRAILYARA